MRVKKRNTIQCVLSFGFTFDVCQRRYSVKPRIRYTNNVNGMRYESGGRNAGR
jgi:hypothetical protein